MCLCRANDSPCVQCIAPRWAHHIRRLFKADPVKLKHLEISDIIERRIRHGDYAIAGLPAERELADDVGASRVTVRKALTVLEQKGLLHRAANKTAGTHRGGRADGRKYSVGVCCSFHARHGILSRPPAVAGGRRRRLPHSGREDEDCSFPPLGRSGSGGLSSLVRWCVSGGELRADTSADRIDAAAVRQSGLPFGRPDAVGHPIDCAVSTLYGRAVARSSS